MLLIATDQHMYAFFWVIRRRLKFICRRFGTLCLFNLHRLMNMEHTECSETSAYKLQTPGNYPEERLQHSEHGESLKSRRRTHFMENMRLQRPEIKKEKIKCTPKV